MTTPNSDAFGNIITREPNGLANLLSILNDQPYRNSALSVIEIKTILENKGGFMPDEAVAWFREWRARRANATVESQ